MFNSNETNKSDVVVASKSVGFSRLSKLTIRKHLKIYELMGSMNGEFENNYTLSIIQIFENSSSCHLTIHFVKSNNNNNSSTSSSNNS